METQIKQVNVSILKPNTGCLLTQSTDVELPNRIFSEEICLASTDSPDNWKDISIEEAEKIKKQQEETIDEQRMSQESRPNPLTISKL